MSEKQLNWQARLETCRASGMSMAAWCRQEDVNVHQMYYWKRKFDQNSPLDDEKTKEWLTVCNRQVKLNTFRSLILISFIIKY